MKTSETLQFRLHARSKQFQRRVAEATAIVEEALRLSGGALVSNSWGKDSVVMAHLVWGVDSAVDLVHVGDEHEDLIDNFSQVRDEFLARWPMPYHHVVAQMGGLSSRQGIDQSEVGRLAQTRFIGLRVEENGGRQWSLRKYGPIHQYQVGEQAGTWRVCPLLNWSYLDVWGYTVLYGLPYLNYYDSEFAGEKRYSRTSSICGYRLFDPSGKHGGIHHGRIARLKRYSPAYYNLMVARYPHMATMT